MFRQPSAGVVILGTVFENLVVSTPWLWSDSVIGTREQYVNECMSREK